MILLRLLTGFVVYMVLACMVGFRLRKVHRTLAPPVAEPPPPWACRHRARAAAPPRTVSHAADGLIYAQSPLERTLAVR
jgi:hypothetical protein